MLPDAALPLRRCDTCDNLYTVLYSRCPHCALRRIYRCPNCGGPHHFHPVEGCPDGAHYVTWETANGAA